MLTKLFGLLLRHVVLLVVVAFVAIGIANRAAIFGLQPVPAPAGAAAVQGDNASGQSAEHAEAPAEPAPAAGGVVPIVDQPSPAVTEPADVPHAGILHLEKDSGGQ